MINDENGPFRGQPFHFEQGLDISLVADPNEGVLIDGRVAAFPAPPFFPPG